MASKLTEEQQRQVEDLYAQGHKPSVITKELELTGLGRSVAAHCLNLRNAGVEGPGSRPVEGQSPAPGTASRSAVAEMVEGIERLDELGEKRAARHNPPSSPTSTKDPVETAKGAIETGIELASRGSGNGNGQPQGELLKFLSTLAAQQEKSSQAIIAQLNTQHTNALDRTKEDHRLRMEEMDKKFERERQRDQDYWTRIETARAETDEKRAELEKEERKLVTDRLGSIDEQVTKNLEHANSLIEQREKSSDRYIEMSEKFSAELAELRKEMGKEDGTQELIKHTIEKLGEPIIRAIEKRAGGNNAVAALGTTITPDRVKKEGVNMGLGDKVKGVVKNVLLKQFKPYIEEGLEQVRKHLEKWPKVSIKILVDLLWSWRMYTDVSAYIQTAVTFIVLNDVDELVKKAGGYLTGDLRKALATPKAKKWWAALQDAINERIEMEEKATKAYDESRRKPEEEKKE